MGKHHTGTVEVEPSSNMTNGKIGLMRNTHDITLLEFVEFAPITRFTGAHRLENSSKTYTKVFTQQLELWEIALLADETDTVSRYTQTFITFSR